MSFLIDNLFQYLQVDVLESQWTLLEKNIAKSEDFEQVRLIHEKFLDSIIQQCFLRLTKVFRAIQDVINTCSVFCRLFLKLGDEENGEEEDEFN